ncbi:MAG: hypothetical protein ACT4OO_05740 [Nitrospiraceae bacterium]
MKNTHSKKNVLPIMVALLAVVALASTPALAKSAKKASGSSSVSSAAAAAGPVAEPSPAPKPGQYDTKPGQAWKTVGGTVKNINGDMYTVEDFEGNQVKLYVGQGTKHMRGNKKVGDIIRAEITRGGFANSIQ